MSILQFYRVRDVNGEPIVKAPTRASDKEAGTDFYVPNDFTGAELGLGDSIKIGLGIHVRIPPNHALIFHNKSGVAGMNGLMVGASTVDESYQGELFLNLYRGSTVGGGTVKIKAGNKIIQGILIPVTYPQLHERHALIDMFPCKSARGDNAFGSNFEDK